MSSSAALPCVALSGLQPSLLSTQHDLSNVCAAPEAQHLLEAARQAGFNKAEAAILHQTGSYHEAMLCLLHHDASGAQALDYCEESLGSLQADLRAHQAFRAAILQAMPGLAKVGEESCWTSLHNILQGCVRAGPPSHTGPCADRVCRVQPAKKARFKVVPSPSSCQLACATCESCMAGTQQQPPC